MAGTIVQTRPVEGTEGAQSAAGSAHGEPVVLVDVGIVPVGNEGTWPAPQRLILAAPESDMAVILDAFRPRGDAA